MTNINATAETIRGIAAALAKARLLDDRFGTSDEGRIAAWSEAADPYQLGQQDLLDGVTAYYTHRTDGRMMQVGDLIATARSIRRERLEREEAEAERRSRKVIDHRVDDAANAIADTKKIPPPEVFKYQRRGPNRVLLVRCPWCKASPNRPCVIPMTSHVLSGGKVHDARIEAARTAGVHA